MQFIHLIFIFLAWYNYTNPYNESDHPQTHLYVNYEEQKPSTLPNIPSDSRTAKINYCPSHYPIPQQLAVVMEWMKNFTPQQAYDSSKIAHLQKQLNAQQQLSEWKNHTAILNQRNNAIQQLKNGNLTIYTQHYSIPRKMRRYYQALTTESNIIKVCTGDILQQTIHNEFITINEKNANFWCSHTPDQTISQLTSLVADCAQAGTMLNHANDTNNALLLADTCWMILDCIQAVGEGLLEGTCSVVDDIIHPIRTAQNIIQSAVTCGYYIGKVLIEIGQLEYLTLNHDYNEISNKYRAWDDNFALVYNEIQNKCSTLKTRDVIKGAVAFGTQCYATPKVLHSIGKLFSSARKYATTVAQYAKNPGNKAHALTTPEGVVIRIAGSTVESLSHTQKEKNITAGISTNKEIVLPRDPYNQIFLEIKNPILNNLRTGSALKNDALHAFNNIIDNYTGYAKEFNLIGEDGVTHKLYQIEWSLNGKSGIFEWIIDPNPTKGVTHRRFIEGVEITGKPNAIRRRL